MTVYMYNDVLSLENKFLKALYWPLLTIQVIFIAIAMVLHTADILHLAATLQYMHIIIVCSLVYFSMVLIFNLKTNKIKNKFFWLECFLLLYVLHMTWLDTV